MNNQALEVIFARNAFYKRMHFLVLAALTLSICVVLFLSFLMAYIWRNPRDPLYFATDNVSRLIKIVPVTVPNMSLSEVTAWTIEAVQNTLSYDYVNYRAEFQNAQKYFTPFGWTNYMQGVKATNNLLALTQRKMIVIAKIVEPPKLVTQGVLGGAYAWKFDMPVLVTYWLPPYTEQSKFLNALQASVIVQRQPILQSHKGLGIVQIIATMPLAAPQEVQASSPGV